MGKNIGKNTSKSLIAKYRQNLLDHAKESATYAFKTASKRRTQETAEQLVIWLVIKFQIELRSFEKFHKRIT